MHMDGSMDGWIHLWYKSPSLGGLVLDQQLSTSGSSLLTAGKTVIHLRVGPDDPCRSFPTQNML